MVRVRAILRLTALKKSVFLATAWVAHSLSFVLSSFLVISYLSFSSFQRNMYNSHDLHISVYIRVKYRPYSNTSFLLAACMFVPWLWKSFSEFTLRSRAVNILTHFQFRIFRLRYWTGPHKSHSQLEADILRTRRNIRRLQETGHSRFFQTLSSRHSRSWNGDVETMWTNNVRFYT
jgi:hypothetical protein